jgi:tetratricopeptide (TPR) repeat protein
LTAYRIGPLTTDRLRRPRARFRLAGRRDELTALLDELEAASAGPGRLVQLTGSAGMGKSRLIDELHERRPHASLVMVACNQYEAATAYHAAGSLIRSVLDLPDGPSAAELEDAVEARAPQLLDVLPLLGDVVGAPLADNDHTRGLTATYRAERAVEAACSLLDVLVPDPAIVVIEDLHWVDPESWAVVNRIARTLLPARRWLLVLTSRHRLVLDDDDGRVVELGPLPPEVARELVFAAVEEGLVPLDRGQVLLEKAGGNPFFLQELLRSGAGGEDLPSSIDALIQTQLDQLPPRDRELLGYAAVLGAEVDVDLLARTAGVPAAEQRATFSRLSSFVEPAAGGSFRFRHALVHDGAYARLPFRRRRELHRAAAVALEQAPSRRVDLLALHTFHARDWDRAVAHSIEAAEAAAARYANLTAAGHYRRALEAARYAGGGSVDLATTWERLGDALLLAASYDDAMDAYRRARDLAPSERHVRLAGQIGQLRERQGRFGDALRWLNRAIRLAPETAGSERSRLLAESGIVRIRQGRARDALTLGTRAETWAEDALGRARAVYVQTWAALLLGEDRVEEQRRMVELFEESGDGIGLSLAYQLVAMAAYYRGDWGDAVDAYQRGASYRRRMGDEVAAAVAAGNIGEVLSDQGHFDRARGLLHECRTVCGAAGFRSSRCFAELTLGRLEARVGGFETAEALLLDAARHADEMGMAGLHFDAQRYLAELAGFRGDVDTVESAVEGLERSATVGFAAVRLVGLRLRTAARTIAGDVPGAVTVARELVDRLERTSRDYDTALSLVAVGTAFADAGEPAAGELQARAATALARLGVVVPGELLVFGPRTPRLATAPRVAAGPAEMVVVARPAPSPVDVGAAAG